MSVEIGIILAFAAMLCWGFGDFLEQKSARRFGDLETAFIITLFGALVLFPFTYKNIPNLFHFGTREIIFLFVGAIAYFIAGLLDLESLKRGKISVVEPIWSLEIPVSTLAAYFIIKETIGIYQIALIILLIAGLFLVSLRKHHFRKEAWLERGVVISLLAAGTMGFANFLIGMISRISDAVLTRWVFCVFLAIFSFVGLVFQGELKKVKNNLEHNKGFLAGMSLLDNAAWLFFGFAMVFAPIAIAVALSESYIIIAVLLGLFISKEKLIIYQKIGIILAIVAAIALVGSIG
jgi:drug/metabolite transporter (DMT)-like permease